MEHRSLGRRPGLGVRTAAEDTPEQLYGLWEDSVARSRANLTVALADGDPGRLTQLIWPDGQSPSIRRMLVDMIEEYARHTGHLGEALPSSQPTRRA